MVGVGKFFGKE